MNIVTFGMTGWNVSPIAFGTCQLGGEWGEFDERALRVDYVDIYQVHWPDPDVPFAETAAALEGLVQEGTILTSASPTTTPPRWPSSHARGLWRRCSRPTTCSAATPRPRCFPTPTSTTSGCSSMGRSHTAADRQLTGSMVEHTTFAADDWRSRSSVFHGEAFRRNLEMVSELARVAVDELGTSVAQLAVAWTLANPAVHVAIVGARSRRHIEESAAAAELRLSEVDLEQIDRIMADSAVIAGPFPEMDRLSTETSVFTETRVS
jgi:aryl-alcohol dehydrogenase-like predicted oxidoreductase